MPESSIETRQSLTRLDILAADGELDEELAPDIDDDTLGRLHETMLLARRFDERLLKLQRAGSIGTFAPVQGQEASNLGPVATLRERDWLVPSFRETAAQLWRGVDMEAILLYIAGYNEGAAVPEGGRDLPNAVPVATQIPHAVGLAYASKLRGDDDVTMVYFGDGATSEGDFHEALNCAAVWNTPTVFVCQNNQWAISTPVDIQTDSRTLAQKALAYGMPGIQVDGNDLLACYEAGRRAVERARAGEGPTLIECVTYRLSLHTTADDPSKYRDEEEVEEWRKVEPLPRFQQFLKDRGLLDDEAIESLEQDVEERIDRAWQAVKDRMAELDEHPEHMFEHCLADLPTYVERQRQAFLQARKGDDG